MCVNIVQWHIMYPCSIFRKPTILYKCNYNLQVCGCTHKSICTCDRTLSYLSIHIYMLSVSLILTPQWIFKDDYYPLSSHLSTFSIASLLRNQARCVLLKALSFHWYTRYKHQWCIKSKVLDMSIWHNIPF